MSGGPARDRELLQANNLRFPPACCVFGEAEHLSPHHQVESELDDGQPDAVLVEPVRRKIGQPGVLGGANAVLAAGAATCRNSRSWT